MTNPMTLNKSLAEFLSQPSSPTNDVGLDLLKHLILLPQQLGTNDHDLRHGEKKVNPGGLDRGSMVYFENLLSALCEQCVSSDWN
jgi:hypothetical protein